MLSILRKVLITFALSILALALLVSVSVNVYYYSTATSLNDSLRRQTGYGSRLGEDSPLQVLEIARTQAYVDRIVNEALSIQRESLNVKNENTRLKTTLRDVRNELSSAQRTGGVTDYIPLIIQLLAGF